MKLDWGDVIAAVLIFIGVVTIATFLFINTKSNAIHQQEYRIACIEAGGSIVEDNCINTNPPLKAF